MRRAFLTVLVLALAAVVALQVGRRVSKAASSADAETASLPSESPRSDPARPPATPLTTSTADGSATQAGDAPASEVTAEPVRLENEAPQRPGGAALAPAAAPKATPTAAPVAGSAGTTAPAPLADDASAKGELPEEARQLTAALEQALASSGAEGMARADQILTRLRAVNDRLWFQPTSTFRSTLEAPAPLSKVAGMLAKREPPARVGIGFLARMNRISDPDRVPGHRKLRVPVDSLRIVVRRASYSLVLYLGEFAVDAFPIGIGKSETPTPPGDYAIEEVQHLDKFERAATAWRRPEDGAVFYYGDANYPFGRRFLRFAFPFEHYGIHGTDRDDAIGAAVSHGCVRMRNADVEALASYLESAAPPR
ncbi:MAG TPA: L,D-transpeptidase, partial [Planctomycetota bacterium]|nr:L,D-transpeptidase [Planctomycetota bacterium]